MSMLSSMCERLRQAADEVERIADKNAVRLGLDAIALRYAVGELRDAADTIDGLRIRCQDVQAENEKLRHENEALRADATHWELEHCPACKNVADLQEAISERERLRELVLDMFTTISWCNLDCYPSDNKKHEYADRMRELGLEVE